MTTTHLTRILSLHDVIGEGVGSLNRLDDHLSAAARDARGFKRMLRARGAASTAT
jgi:hypothetical protein